MSFTEAFGAFLFLVGSLPVCLRFVDSPPIETGSIPGHPHSTSARRTLWGRKPLPPFCRGHQHMELGWGEIASVAKGTMWNGGKGS